LRASSLPFASTQRVPSGPSSSFQNGASVFNQSIRKAQDSSAASRWLEPGVAVNNESRCERPAPLGFGLDLGETFFRHAGVMLERHRGRGSRALRRNIADEANEARDAADLMIPGGELFELRADVEILGLDPDGHLRILGCISRRSPAGTKRPRRRL
jgi:hypothetical protein